MPEGIIIHQCYPAQRKLKELTYLNYIMNFEYSEGRPQESEPAMQELLRRDSLVIRKKSNKAKAGYTEVDLIPLIQRFNLECQSDTLTLDAVVRARIRGLIRTDSGCLLSRVSRPGPDFVTFHRREVLDGDGKVFR